MSLKRLAAPRFWKIERKTKKFVVEPKPGPHSSASCLPLGIILRDILKHAYTMKEVKNILNNRYVKIDGRVRKEHNFPVGLMDIVSVGEETYRVLPSKYGLQLGKIGKNESNIRLLRIENKVYVKKGRLQLNLHDGKNIIVDKNDYKTGDVLVFDIDKKTINDVLRFEKGTKALIIAGNNIGSLVTIEDIIITKSSMPNQVAVDLGGKKFMLPMSHIFVVGKEPVIKLGG